MSNTLIAIEALIVSALLATSYVSSRPELTHPKAFTDESERIVEECSQQGGNWNECNMREMMRVFKQ